MICCFLLFPVCSGTHKEIKTESQTGHVNGVDCQVLAGLHVQ